MKYVLLFFGHMSIITKKIQLLLLLPPFIAYSCLIIHTEYGPMLRYGNTF